MDDVIQDIVKEGPSIIGIYVMITMSRPALNLVERLEREMPGVLMVTGGPMPTLYPERFADRFDLVFRGEADLAFPAFCHDYLERPDHHDLSHGLDLTRYPGLYRRHNGRVFCNPTAPLSQEEVDRLPLPDRSTADHQAYQEFWMDRTGRRVTTLMTTRGCPYCCDFCSKPIFGNTVRKRSVERIMDEMGDISRLGYDQLWIADDCFTLDLGYVRSFCEGLNRSGLGMTWSCLSRVDAIDSELVEVMREAGCIKVYLGLESGSDATLRLMNKRTTVAEGIRATNLFHDAGIEVGGFFLVGYPGEVISSVESTFNLALSLPLDEISFNVPYPLPGSSLYSRVELLSPEDDWEVENDIRFLFRSEFDQDWLKRRISETMEEFARSRDQGSGGEPRSRHALREDPVAR